MEPVEPLVLVVEDDGPVRRSLERALPTHGFRVVAVPDGLEAMVVLRTERPDVIVLDVGLPGPDGLALTQRLRGDGDDVPVLMLTARDAVGDRVAGLEAGADDYLTKPFALEELTARLRSLMRRRTPGAVPLRRRIGDVVLDVDGRTVRRGDRTIELTPTEFDLLDLLMASPGRVVTRERIVDTVWDDPTIGPNALEQHIAGLRRRLEVDGGARIVHTVRGVGYVARP